MKTSAHDHLHSIFKEKGSPLQKIFNAYEAHQQLSHLFQKALPEIYQNQVQFILYRGGVMTLGVRNSALYTRLAYVRDELIEHFKKQPEWAGLREIKIKMLV